MDKNKCSIINEETLYKGWSELKRYTLDFEFVNGKRERMIREIYNSGNGAAVLLYNQEVRQIVLLRQFRLTAWLSGQADGCLLEVCAGMLDYMEPEEAIKKEVREETGLTISQLQKVGEVFVTPGAHEEKVHLYTAVYDPKTLITGFRLNPEEQEELEVLTMTFDEAIAMAKNGSIEDAKTLLLLQHAIINGILD